VPLGGRKAPLAQAAAEGPSGSAIENLPYINLPMMFYPTGAADPYQSFQTSGDNWKGMVESWPRHMTIWVNNYRYTEYDETDSAEINSLFRGAFLPPNGTHYEWTAGKRQGADSIAYGNAPAGTGTTDTGSATAFYLNPETEVFIDNIELKYFNHPITNHSIQAGEMQRFINMQNNKVLTPATTHSWNTVQHGAGNASIVPTGTATTLRTMRAFNHEGVWTPRNPGYNISVGFKDDPATYFPVSGTTGTGDTFLTGSVHDIYLLLNNFSTAQFGRIDRLSPDIAWKPVAGAFSSGNIDGESTNFASALGTEFRGRNWASGTVISGGSSANDNRAAWAGSGYTYSPEAAGWAYYPIEAGAGVALDGKFSFGSGANTYLSCDGLTQKGFLRMSQDLTYNDVTSTSITDAVLTDEDETVTCGAAAINVGDAVVLSGGALDYGMPNGTIVASINAGTPGVSVTSFEMSAEATVAGTKTLFFAGATVLDRWQKAGNAAVAAKIMGVQGSHQIGQGEDEIINSNTLIRVDTPDIFAEALDDTYLIYRQDRRGRKYNADGTAATASTNHRYTNYQLGYKRIIKLATTTTPTSLPDEVIELVVYESDGVTLVPDGVLFADDGITKLCTSANLGDLWITPLRYWLNMSFINENLDYRRSYESLNAINKVPDDSVTAALGSTYNEWLYSYNTGSEATKGTSGIYEKPWILGNAENTSLVLTTDYGYGAYDEDTDRGGQLGEATAVLNQYCEADISGIVGGGSGGGMLGGGISTEQDLNLLVELSRQSSSKTITLVGDDHATLDDEYKPALIWQFHDELPSVSKLVVSPAFNALEKDVNLYELTTENLNSLKFTWEEEGDDIWYRMLMVDTEAIPDKYHKCSFHMPLNEFKASTQSGNKPQFPAYKFYNYTSGSLNLPPTGGSTKTSTSAACRTSIEGLAGYAFLGQSADSTPAEGKVPEVAFGTSANQNILLSGMSEYTFVIHGIPATSDAGNYMFTQGDQGGWSSADSFYVKLNPDKKVEVTHGAITLTGTSIQLCDGETPLSVIVTFKTGDVQSGRQPLELYVNGVLEDYDTTTGTAAVDSGEWGVVGALYNTDDAKNTYTWEGLLEEVLIYKKRWAVVPQGGEYIFNSETLLEKANIGAGTGYTAAGKWQTQNAKLFVFDYHNIRGRASDVVAQSNLVGWKVTTP